MRVLGIALSLALLSCAPSGPAPSAVERSGPTSVDATASTATPVSAVDCGLSDLRPPADHDAAALDCFWKAYSAGHPVRWSVVKYTQEGAPIPSTLTFGGGVLIVTRDLSKDEFSSPADRRVWAWRCAALRQRPWVTDPQRYSFELSNCTGDGPRTAFP